MPKRPRWRRRKEARPEEILEAALDVFVERGYAAARLDQVARHAGVTKGTIYLYFPSKAALFKAVVRGSLVVNMERAEAVSAAHRGSAADLLRQFVWTVWRTVGDTKLSGIPKLIVAEAANFPEIARFYWSEVASRALGVWSSIIERGIEAGEFRRVNPRFATMSGAGPLLFALIFKHSLYPVSGTDFDFHAFIEAHIDTYLRGLARE
ncbi:MAG: TetR/AcrR family transcriptional regulator [Gemmatimonadales bacterium]